MSGSLPTVSVVIASGAGGEFLFRLLESLREQAHTEDAEVIVADRVGGATAERLAREASWVALVSVARGADGRKPGVPQLRAAAVARARGEVVVIIEEHCRAPAGWLRAIRESFAADDAAIGGPILDDGWTRLADWAVYFSEYHNYLPPWPDGERTALNGANVAYRRELLTRHAEVLDRGYWEVVLHPRLSREGRMRGVQRLGAHHTGPFPLRYYLRQRFLLSRVWGAMRRGSLSLPLRAAYLVLAPLFPLLLLARIASRALRAGRFGRFLLALPLLVPIAVTYVAGEWSGIAFGMGRALEEVE